MAWKEGIYWTCDTCGRDDCKGTINKIVYTVQLFHDVITTKVIPCPECEKQKEYFRSKAWDNRLQYYSSPKLTQEQHQAGYEYIRTEDQKTFKWLLVKVIK